MSAAIFTERELLESLIDTDQHDLLAIDTGQDALALDTGQDVSDELLLSQLVVRKHEIHRKDELADGESELVTSTLKYFHIDVALVDLEGAAVPFADGARVHATLVYEDGGVVEEVSASLEPPLLGGDAQLEGGCASFRLRVTVLTSLCQCRKFRVHIALESRPEIFVLTREFKTITKLRRGSRGGANKEAAKEAAKEESTEVSGRTSPQSPLPTVPNTSVKRALSASAPPAPGAKQGAKEVAESACAAVDKSKTTTTPATVAGTRSLTSLWDEVRANSQTLIQLQKQQQDLFAELRRLAGKSGDATASTLKPSLAAQAAIRT